jgi:hypothetical protein
MRRMTSRALRVLRFGIAAGLWTAASSSACSTSDSTTADSYGGGAAGADAGGDVARSDSAADTRAESAAESAAETGPEAAAEAGAETAHESGPDTTVDSPVDAGADQEAEAAHDAHAADADAAGDAPTADKDAPEPWPTCDAPSVGATPRTLPQIWQDDPTSPSRVWVSGVFVTAISKGGCQGGQACQLFVQDAESFASLAAGAHHALKLFVSSTTAAYFASIALGDKVDVEGFAWRYDLDPPQHELLIQVNKALPGCAKKVGTGTPAPVTGVKLPDLTVSAYEQTVGPLLVQVAEVSGKPGAAAETFALWPTSGPFVDAGPESVVSLSPYFLPGGAFTGLPTGGTTTVKFQTVTGVFGLFVPPSDGGSAAKYLMIYPRTMADVVKAP